jgi:hypothetical protein
MQTLHFLDEQTLSGSKKTVYVLLKLLKYCTGSPAKSYELKYAVFHRLLNLDPDIIGLWNAIREVMKYRTIRGKFDLVHEDLKKEGIARVEVLDEGFCFVRITEGKILV